MAKEAFSQPRSSDVSARELNFTRGDVRITFREEYRK